MGIGSRRRLKELNIPFERRRRKNQNKKTEQIPNREMNTVVYSQNVEAREALSATRIKE